MSRTAIAAAAIVLSLGLAACETATPYQPNIPGQATSGGYSESRLEPDRWRVNFVGNTMTSRETVEGYLLYRAAELTLQNGDDWFAMVDRNTERRGYQSRVTLLGLGAVQAGRTRPGRRSGTPIPAPAAVGSCSGRPDLGRPPSPGGCAGGGGSE